MVDEDKIWTWVHNSRLPLFWGSELFLEWRLCSQLVQDVQLGTTHFSLLFLNQ